MLKTVALAIALWIVPALACASDLVVGVVHDSDGYPVSGASVALRTAGGALVARGPTADDGTFAIDASGAIATVDIACTYCMRVTVARGRVGTPLVVVVRRFAALRDRGISAADARVLPYTNATTMAALMPFAVASGGSISDRGLANGEGTAIADGIPLYRATDGVDLGTAIPAHATAAVAETGPTHANAYDSRSAGGVFSFDTLDPSAGTARVDAGPALDGTLRAGGNVVTAALATAGGADAATRGVVDAALPTAGGTVDLRAVDASTAAANATGAAATLALPVSGGRLNASITQVRSSDGNGPENDNVAALSLERADITIGVRAQRSSGLVGSTTGVQYDARGFIEATRDAGVTRIFLSLAAARTGDDVSAAGSATSALLPIVSVATHLTPSFVMHADSVDALTPAGLDALADEPQQTAVVRSHLLDAGLGYDDAHRVRIDAMVFRQTSAGTSPQVTGGSGISAVWQIAPAIAVRAWALIAQQSATAIGDDAYAAGSLYPASASGFDRQIVWVTAGNALRVDAIERSGKLEGDVSFPLGAQYRFVAGTQCTPSSRTVSFGLTYR